MIGRIHKSQWLEASNSHDVIKARQYLVKAVDAYVRGFEADWRDIYPGVNAVTLLEARGDDDALALKARLLPVVRFAAEQKLRVPRPTYWDYATLLELAVLDGDVEVGNRVMDGVLAAQSETWQPQSTAGNLRIIEGIRSQRGEDVTWIGRLIDQLEAAASVQSIAGPAGSGS